MRRSGAFVMAVAPLWGSIASQDALQLGTHLVGAPAEPDPADSRLALSDALNLLLNARDCLRGTFKCTDQGIRKGIDSVCEALRNAGHVVTAFKGCCRIHQCCDKLRRFRRGTRTDKCFNGCSRSLQ